MGWVVDLEKEAHKWVDRHPNYRKRVEKAIDDLKRDPYTAGEPLGGEFHGFWKYKIGRDVRLIYDIDHKNRIVTVWIIGNRKNVYKKLRKMLR